MRENSIASTDGQLADNCRHQSRSSFPVAPQLWFPFYQQTCLHVAAGKQYSGQFLLDSRHSGRAPPLEAVLKVVTDSLPTQIPRAPNPHSHKTDPWVTGYHEPPFTARSILFSAFWQLRYVPYVSSGNHWLSEVRV